MTVKDALKFTSRFILRDGSELGVLSNHLHISHDAYLDTVKSSNRA